MVITRANYQIALRLIQVSLVSSRKLIKRIIRWLIRISFSLLLSRHHSSFLLAHSSLPQSASALSQTTVSCQRGWSFICIQTTTVNKPFLVVSSGSWCRRRDVLQSDHVISGHVIRVFDTHRIHQKRFVYARPIRRRAWLTYAHNGQHHCDAAAILLLMLTTDHSLNVNVLLSVLFYRFSFCPL